MLIRTVAAAEVEVCRVLGGFLFEAYTSLPGHVHEPDYEAELADVAARAAMPDTEVLGAFEGDRPLGCVTFVTGSRSPMVEHGDPDAATFRMLGVDPAAQGRGAGEALVRKCVDRARGADRKALLLHTTPWMVGAQRLYERLGFVREPNLDLEPIPGIGLLGYRLDLTSSR